MSDNTMDVEPVTTAEETVSATTAAAVGEQEEEEKKSESIPMEENPPLTTKYLKLSLEIPEDLDELRGGHVTFLYYGKGFETKWIHEAVRDLGVSAGYNQGYLLFNGWANDFGPEKNLCVIKYRPSMNLGMLRARLYNATPPAVQALNHAGWCPHITLSKKYTDAEMEELCKKLKDVPLLVHGISCNNGYYDF
jgi:hypothetical protein